MGKVTDFSININPLGMPETAKEAAVRSLESAGRYPDWRHTEIREAAARYHGISEEWIIAGNGASELIYALTLSCGFQVKAWIPAPTFMEYEEAVLAAGGDVISDVPFPQKNGDVPEGCNMIFLCNPNNPTGTLYEPDDLRQLADLCDRNDILLCIDESFLPFLFEEQILTMTGAVQHVRNLLIFRSLTKIYGMPGLRIGYAVSGNRALLERMNRVLQPWNLSMPAEAAACAALKDGAYLSRTRNLILKERIFLENTLNKYVEKVVCGTANFIYFEDIEHLDQILLEEGILIRNCENIRGLGPGSYRIGVRTHAENEYLANVMRKIRS